MVLEILDIDGVAIPHRVIKITGDGACLFSSLSYLVHGTASLTLRVRADIVRHVSNNWCRLKPYTLTITKVPYSTKRQYIADLSQPYFYGTFCELMVAAEVYPYRFELFRDRKLLACYGDDVQGVKRLMFSGDDMAGHFDVLIPCEQPSIANSIKISVPVTKSYTSVLKSQHGFSESVPSEPIASKPDPSSLGVYEPADVQPGSSQLILSNLETPLDTSSDESIVTPQKFKGRKRRKRFTDSIRKKQVRESVAKYSQLHPD